MEKLKEDDVREERRNVAILNDYVKSMMNEENDWDHNVEGDALEGPVDSV